MRELPDVWEYLLYAGAMLAARDEIEDLYRDHLIGYAPLAGESLDANESIGRLQGAFPDAQALAKQIERMFNAELQERAFGIPGQSGDEALIRQLAERTMAQYRGLLEWAGGLRSARVPEEFQTAYQLAADLVNKPIEQVRAFVDEVVAQMDSVAERIERDDDDSPIQVTVALVVSIEEGATDAFIEELGSLEATLL